MTKDLKTYFWLAVLAHLLLFFSSSFILILNNRLAFEKKSDRYLPAYLYQDESIPLKAITHPNQNSQKTTSPEPKDIKSDHILLKKQELQKAMPSNQPQTTQSTTVMEAESLKSGKHIDEPLLKELSRATAAKLFYPSEAAAFKISGTVTISFLLYPDGQVAEIAIAQSSGFHILDQAALNTIKSISPVRDANLYLTKPRRLLAGIIFE